MTSVVTELCPIACCAVILVRGTADGNVFAWCPGCGAAWADPRAEKWVLGDPGRWAIHACLVANGAPIEIASGADIRAAGLDDLVVRETDDDWFRECVEDYNREYGSDPNIVARAEAVTEGLRRLAERED